MEIHIDPSELTIQLCAPEWESVQAAAATRGVNAHELPASDMIDMLKVAIGIDPEHFETDQNNTAQDRMRKILEGFENSGHIALLGRITVGGSQGSDNDIEVWNAAHLNNDPEMPTSTVTLRYGPKPKGLVSALKEAWRKLDESMYIER